MEKNIVIQKLEEVVGTDALLYISGIINNCGTDNCEIEGEMGDNHVGLQARLMRLFPYLTRRNKNALK